MFLLGSLSKSKFFTHAALCRSCSTRGALVSLVSHLYHTRVVGLALVLHVCRTRVARVSLVPHLCR